MSPPRILVAYATAGGSTREVAERIGARLHEAGVVEVRPAGPGLRIDGVDAFVVGSAVHDMAWLPPAREFAGRLAPALDGRPVWLFSVGGLDPRGRFRTWMGRQELARIGRGLPAGLAARDHRLFGGVVRTRGVPL
ncbi:MULTISPECIES: flavodoxin domain-containing protein [unclassified Blastococcus]